MKNDYFAMFCISVIAGLLSTMNVWADNIKDMSITINDIYMVLLMTAWMFLLMGIYYRKLNLFIYGLIFVLILIWCIRSQFLVSESQFRSGMITHHSMAIHMSKKLLNKDNKIKNFLENLIKSQEEEINFLKKN